MINKRNCKKTKNQITVDIQADFWNGDPDIDAICRIEHAPICEFDIKPESVKNLTFNLANGKKIKPLMIKLNGLLHLQKISLLKKIHLMHTSYPLVLGIFLILKNHWVKHIEC